MKKIIVFGGSFDPIHEGHIKIALSAFKKVSADKLFFVPCGELHPTNKIHSANKTQRFEMIKLAISKYSYFEIDDYELNKNEINYSIDTVEYFNRKYSDSEIYLLIGEDQLNNFEKWKDYKKILNICKIITHTRKCNNTNVNSEKIPHIKIGINNINISSSEIRVKPIKKYVNNEVLEYINKYGIYAVDRLKKVMSKYRLDHSIQVANIARMIANHHNLETLIDKAYVAGIYHDYAKEMDKDFQIKIAEKLKIKNYPSWKTLHGDVGAYLINRDFFIDDYQVLLAIKNHVIPNDFSTLTKILYIADKIAPRHDSDNDLIKKWNILAKENIDKCFNEVLDFNKKIFS